MSDHDRSSPSSPSPQASSSESPSPDASASPLDRVSARDLVRWIEGVNQSLADIKKRLDTSESTTRFREGGLQRSIDLGTAALGDHDKRIAAWKLSNDNLVKLVREVLAEERKDRAALGEGLAKIGREVEKTGEHLTQKPEPADEITGEHIKLRWSTIGGFFAKWGPFAVKAAAVVGGAAITAWHFAEREIRAAWSAIKNLFH